MTTQDNNSILFAMCLELTEMILIVHDLQTKFMNSIVFVYQVNFMVLFLQQIKIKKY